MIRVLIADDHAVVRQGLRTFLDLQADIDVVGEAADGEEAVAAAAEHAPDVILLDLVMPRLDGLGALRRLREAAPAARVIVLTSFGEDERLFTALRAGASGYLLKDVEPSELVRSIRTAHSGGAPLSPTVATRVVEELASGGGAGRAPADDLTPRELEVLCLIARGRSNKRIALELGIAECVHRARELVSGPHRTAQARRDHERQHDRGGGDEQRCAELKQLVEELTEEVRRSAPAAGDADEMAS